jgi:hypothetical protein
MPFMGKWYAVTRVADSIVARIGRPRRSSTGHGIYTADAGSKRVKAERLCSAIGARHVEEKGHQEA